MTAGPAFVRFTSPFWFGLQGYFAQQDGTVVETDLYGRQVLVAVGEVDDEEPFVGVVRPGSVLPVYAYDERFQTVSVWLPEPWLQDENGLPLHDASVLAPVDPGDRTTRHVANALVVSRLVKQREPHHGRSLLPRRDPAVG